MFKKSSILTPYVYLYVCMHIFPTHICLHIKLHISICICTSFSLFIYLDRHRQILKYAMQYSGIIYILYNHIEAVSIDDLYP